MALSSDDGRKATAAAAAAAGRRAAGPAAAGAFRAIVGPLALPPEGEPAAGKPAAGKRARRRSQRPLFFAEQVMADRQQPKKKYLATQRIRRDVERSQVESLVLDVNFLKQEIAELETVRDILRSNRLAARATTVCNLMAVVHEYFGKIQHGFGRETSASSVTLAQKVDFLRSVFDENVDFGTGRGLDAFIAQCQGYTLFHASFYYEAPETAQISPTGDDHAIVIVARNRLRVRVSRQTIAIMFPHLIHDEVMVQALIGSELVYPCEITIYFDKRGRVVRHDAIVDFVAGLTAALNNLQQVMRVMDSARLQGSLIVYDRSRAEARRPPRSVGVKRQRRLEAAAPTNVQGAAFTYAVAQEKRPSQEPPTSTLSDGFAHEIQSHQAQFYSSPPPGALSASASDELESAPFSSPSSKTATQSKETVSSRMSIHGLLSSSSY